MKRSTHATIHFFTALTLNVTVGPDQHVSTHSHKNLHRTKKNGGLWARPPVLEPLPSQANHSSPPVTRRFRPVPTAAPRLQISHAVLTQALRVTFAQWLVTMKDSSQSSRPKRRDPEHIGAVYWSSRRNAWLAAMKKTNQMCMRRAWSFGFLPTRLTIVVENEGRAGR